MSRAWLPRLIILCSIAVTCSACSSSTPGMPTPTPTTGFHCGTGNIFSHYADPVPIPDSALGLVDLTTGPDGNLWFTHFASGLIGRVTPTGTITELQVTNIGDAGPNGITAGPDGNVWFTITNHGGNGTEAIGRITPMGMITTFPIPATMNDPEFITLGPDHNLWFTESWGKAIGRVTTTGTFTQFTLASGNEPNRITAGPDGNLWFGGLTDVTFKGFVGRITPQGIPTGNLLPNTGSTGITGMTSGPDGNLWFSDYSAETIDRMTPSGELATFPDTNYPDIIVQGPDGNLWFTEVVANKIGRITPSGTVTEFPIPETGSPNKGPEGITTGPDGKLWFALEATTPEEMGSVTTNGTFAFYPFGDNLKNHLALEIVTGSDGNLWFTEGAGLVRLTTGGTFTPYLLPTGSDPFGIAVGTDGNLWFAATGSNRVGHMDTSGSSLVEYGVPSYHSLIHDITSSPDGNLWFTENGANKIGCIAPSTGNGMAPVMPTATPPATPMPTSTPVPTATPAPTATTGPTPGVCKASDFSMKMNGGPNEGFAYPPLTYSSYEGNGAGNTYYVLCSSGTPTSILTFLKTSIPAGGWQVTSVTATTLAAQKPTNPATGFCYSLNITVGAHAGYPGEWDADFHPPALSC